MLQFGTEEIIMPVGMLNSTAIPFVFFVGINLDITAAGKGFDAITVFIDQFEFTIFIFLEFAFQNRL